MGDTEKVMVSLIVVDFNSMERTLEYITHFSENVVNAGGMNAVVIDNYSEQKMILDERYEFDSVRRIENLDVYVYNAVFGRIAYCPSGENLGYARGNNLGTIISDELFGAGYYIVSNNDLIFENTLDWIEIENIFTRKHDVAVIGPRIKSLSGTFQSPNKSVSAFSRIVAYYFLVLKPFRWNSDYDYSGESKYAYRLSGCFMIIKAEDFVAAGRFDPHTFLFAEEMILSERLKKINKKCYFYDELHLLHNHGETVKKNSNGLQAEIWCHESCVYFYKKYMNTGKLTLAMSGLSFSIFKLRKKFRAAIKTAAGR